MGILDIIVLAIIGIYAFRGYKKGFIVTVFTLISMFVAIIVTQTVSPIISRSLINNETVMTAVTNQIDSLSGLWQQSDVDEDEQNADKNKSKLTEKDKQEISSLNLPDAFKDRLSDNEMWEEYKQQGIANVKGYVTRYLAITFINSLTYMIVFAVIIVILKIIIHTLDLISKLPVLKSINKYGGLIVGVGQGVIIIWVLCIVVTVLGSTPIGITLFESINNSPVLSFIYNNNILLNTLLSVGKAIF